MHPTIAKLQTKNLKKVPEVKTGFTVRVSQKVKEGNKERIQNFEGLVIKVGHGAGVEKTFTVRKIVEGIGVEKTFPFHSPLIEKIHVVKKAKVRREKLYYMRDRFGKSARLTEKQVTDEERKAEEARLDALYAEALEAEEKAEETGVAEGVAEEQAAETPAQEVAQASSPEGEAAPETAAEEKPEEEAKKEDAAPEVGAAAETPEEDKKAA